MTSADIGSIWKCSQMGTQLGCINKDNVLNAGWGKGQAAARHHQGQGGTEKATQRDGFQTWCSRTGGTGIFWGFF